MALKELITKYSLSGPRYTSYPTAPQWTESVTGQTYRQTLEAASSPEDPLALYLHIPFCEALCYYCGCNIQITKEKDRGDRYVDALIREIAAVSKHLGIKRKLSQIAWGGGTPTFLPVKDIERLFSAIKTHFQVESGAEISIELDPRVTSDEQLECLARLGFNRMSLGVQDFDLEVQKSVNRVQSADLTRRMLEKCRSLGASGINFDLIYGLPHQTVDRFRKTLEQVIDMAPDRIAFYNYAHLPSMIPHQKIVDKMPMPGADERVGIFLLALNLLAQGGYEAIGMDHFAKRNDELYQALAGKRLYRNFMGYSVKRAPGMLGVGASAIGEISSCYFQNIRSAKEYEERIATGGLATFRGLELSPEDRRRKWIIQSILCRFQLDHEEYESAFKESLEKKYPQELEALAPFEKDGIVQRTKKLITVTSLGRLFIRNVAMLFDEYLKKPQKVQYSKTV